MDQLYFEIVAMLEQGQVTEAEAALPRLCQAEPNSQRVAVLQAALWERKDRPEEATRVLESFIAGGRDNAVARSNLARLQWKKGDRTRAITTLQFGLMQDPNQERALHFYAALLEQDGGWSGALGALEALAQAPGAWLAAWVGAQLASSREPEQVGRLLLLAAKQARVPFPPSPDSLLALLASLPQEQQCEVAGALRPFCRQEAQQKLDALLAVPRLGPQGGESAVTCLRRSVWRHLSQPQTNSALGLAPIGLIKPEGWGGGRGRRTVGPWLRAVDRRKPGRHRRLFGRGDPGDGAHRGSGGSAFAPERPGLGPTSRRGHAGICCRATCRSRLPTSSFWTPRSMMARGPMCPAKAVGPPIPGPACNSLRRD
jgi:hypothetical protein